MELGRRTFKVLVVVLIAVYIALRLWRLTDSCLWFDEIFSVHAAEHSWSTLFWFVAQDLIHPPLFYVFLKLWIGVGGEGMFWLRLFPVLFSVVALVPFIYLCRELKLTTSATLLALALFSVNGALIKYSQEVRMYAPLLCLSLFSLWLFARFYFRGKNIWILTLINVLLVYTHYFGWFVIASEVAAIFIFQRVKIRHVLIMSGIALAAFAPWIFVVVKAANAGADVTQNIGWMKSPGLRALFDFAFDAIEPFYFQQSSAEPTTLIYVTLPLVLLVAAAAIVFLISREKGDDDNGALYLMAVSMLVPMVLAFLISWIAPVSIWGSRHLIIVFAPVSIIIAMLIVNLRPITIQYLALMVIAILFATGFARKATTGTPEFVWCSWEKLAERWVMAPHLSPDPKRLYAFEDLTAYHIWFATREMANHEVALVSGVQGIPNDAAYFL